jgi:hypothetical protein
LTTRQKLSILSQCFGMKSPGMTRYIRTVQRFARENAISRSGHAELCVSLLNQGTKDLPGPNRKVVKIPVRLTGLANPNKATLLPIRNRERLNHTIRQTRKPVPLVYHIPHATIYRGLDYPRFQVTLHSPTLVARPN